jgi:hypothetical protein
VCRQRISLPYPRAPNVSCFFALLAMSSGTLVVAADARHWTSVFRQAKVGA